MAWWLAYEELYGDMDKEYPIMSEKFKDDVTIVGGAGTDTIEIKGAASIIKLLGMADTQQEKIDAELSVTLPLASNLPWVAALAAGLPTAIGVYIISKFMQSQVDKLSSAVYRVDGDFAEPEVKFLRLFDVTN